MPTKEKLLEKLYGKQLPRNFTKSDLSALMSACGCEKGQGGRGSGIRFFIGKVAGSWLSMSRILEMSYIRIRSR